MHGVQRGHSQVQSVHGAGGLTSALCLEYGSVSERPALSAGAIAGISISVILIVGGLAAVLVWLLVFRKKS